MSKVADAFLHLTGTNPQEAPPPKSVWGLQAPFMFQIYTRQVVHRLPAPWIHEWECVFYSAWSQQNSIWHLHEIGSDENSRLHAGRVAASAACALHFQGQPELHCCFSFSTVWLTKDSVLQKQTAAWC